MGEASEGTTEAAPVPEVAEAKSVAAALDGIESVATPIGAVSAPRAARMLMGGGRDGIAPPNARARITPGAALALQRSIGTGALSRRLLMRAPPTNADDDEVEELAVPYTVDASGPNDAASK